MVSQFMADLAADVQSGLADLVDSLTYQEYLATKAASTAAIGATTISLNTLPAGMDRVKAGDTFVPPVGGGTRTFTSEVPAIGGVITAAPFTPALTSAISSGGTVNVIRPHACKGFVEIIDLTRTTVSGITAGDVLVTILADTLDIVPATTGKILTDKVRAIISTGLDAAGCAWTIQARG